MKTMRILLQKPFVLVVLAICLVLLSSARFFSFEVSPLWRGSVFADAFDVLKAILFMFLVPCALSRFIFGDEARCGWRFPDVTEETWKYSILVFASVLPVLFFMSRSAQFQMFYSKTSSTGALFVIFTIVLLALYYAEILPQGSDIIPSCDGIVALGQTISHPQIVEVYFLLLADLVSVIPRQCTQSEDDECFLK